MKRRYSRREFLKHAGIGAAGIAAGPAFLGEVFAQIAGRRTLRILQWSHLVPSHDKWFDVYAKEWGEKNNVDVIVDHIGLADLRSTFAAEVGAGKGHDIVEFIDPPSHFEPAVLDLTGTHFRKRCAYFLGEVLGPVAGIAREHELFWLPPERARELLTHGSQRWAVGLTGGVT